MYIHAVTLLIVKGSWVMNYDYRLSNKQRQSPLHWISQTMLHGQKSSLSGELLMMTTDFLYCITDHYPSPHARDTVVEVCVN